MTTVQGREIFTTLDEQQLIVAVIEQRGGSGLRGEAEAGCVEVRV